MTKPNEWTFEEVSTRNCLHCIYKPDYPVCRQGVELVDSVGKKLETARVEKRCQLYGSCIGCDMFDNKWN
jgi:hypothetical protein